MKKAVDEDYDYVYLLNQDAWVFTQTFERLISAMETDPQYGILSPMQLTATEDKMDHFEKDYDENIGAQTALLATNITNLRKFNIKSPDVVIQVNPERTDLVDVQIIDGRKCLVIPIDDQVEVNGISVNTK